MSKENPKKVHNALKQSRLTAFISNKSNDSPGIENYRQMNVFLNVNLIYRMSMKDAKTIHFVSAIPEAQTSSITSETHSSTSVTGTIDSTTVNLNVTLNVTTDDETLGKLMNVFVDRF